MCVCVFYMNLLWAPLRLIRPRTLLRKVYTLTPPKLSPFVLHFLCPSTWQWALHSLDTPSTWWDTPRQWPSLKDHKTTRWVKSDKTNNSNLTNLLSTLWPETHPSRFRQLESPLLVYVLHVLTSRVSLEPLKIVESRGEGGDTSPFYFGSNAQQ